MSLWKRYPSALLALTAAICAIPSLVSADDFRLRGDVAAANARVGHPDNVIAPGFALRAIVDGTAPIENPSGVITKFGFLNDFPPQPVEATKTEPDENTYLIFDRNPGGPTAGYDYGRHFLYQGHENGNNLAYITRINLDVKDPAHRVTLLSPVGTDGLTHFNSIDGSTWNPFTRTLLFTQEAGANGGVIEVMPGWPANVRTLYGVIGRGGFEGIHPDDRGNVYLIEDAGGVSVNVVQGDTTSPKAAKQPNSFVYRFVPKNRFDLSQGGKLQALQVWIGGAPVVFGSDPVADVFSENQLKLHTVGTAWPVRWVTVHDTDVDGTAAFDANAAAKKAGATPFKRPENMQFRPGSDFRTFFFDPTGDTDERSGDQPALAARGAWGSIFRVDFFPGSVWGRLSIFFLGDKDHAAFDNLAFTGHDTLLAAEDRGDGLHKQLNTLDSIWAFDVRIPSSVPLRLVALGRDPASEIDVNLGEANTPGFQNEGDNEPTGLHFSTGGTRVFDMQGSGIEFGKARLFFTQQHGMNTVWEVIEKERR